MRARAVLGEYEIMTFFLFDRIIIFFLHEILSIEGSEDYYLVRVQTKWRIILVSSLHSVHNEQSCSSSPNYPTHEGARIQSMILRVKSRDECPIQNSVHKYLADRAFLDHFSKSHFLAIVCLGHGYRSLYSNEAVHIFPKIPGHAQHCLRGSSQTLLTVCS